MADSNDWIDVLGIIWMLASLVLGITIPLMVLAATMPCYMGAPFCSETSDIVISNKITQSGSEYEAILIMQNGDIVSHINKFISYASAQSSIAQPSGLQTYYYHNHITNKNTMSYGGPNSTGTEALALISNILLTNDTGNIIRMGHYFRRGIWNRNTYISHSKSHKSMVRFT